MNEPTNPTDAAATTIKHAMLAALGVGLVPFPVVDMAVLVGIQLNMLHKLAGIYGADFSSELGKEIIAASLASVMPVSLSFNASYLLKFVPVYGWLLKGVSTSAFAGAFTYAVGKLFVQHFESGNTFLTLDPQQVKAYFASQFEQGKAEVSKSFVGVKP